jgi:phospholipid-transporting ATPase
MLREGIEDYMRYTADKSKLDTTFKDRRYIIYLIETNSQEVTVLREGEFRQMRSDQLVVGDIVFVKEDDTFAADLILLTSSMEGGTCFIQTSSLDGEKNLKKRSKPKDLDKMVKNTCDPAGLAFLAECVSEEPTAELYSYTGKMSINS